MSGSAHPRPKKERKEGAHGLQLLDDAAARLALARRARRRRLVEKLGQLVTRLAVEARVEREALERRHDERVARRRDAPALPSVGAGALELEHVGALARADAEAPDAGCGLPLRVAEVGHDGRAAREEGVRA